jgi:hypothetical protein
MESAVESEEAVYVASASLIVLAVAAVEARMDAVTSTLPSWVLRVMADGWMLRRAASDAV